MLFAGMLTSSWSFSYVAHWLIAGPALLNIGTLLFLLVFIYTIISMNLFGNLRHNGGGFDVFISSSKFHLTVINEFNNFENFPNAFILMVRLTTAAGWNDVLDACVVQPPDCDPNFNGLSNGDCGHPVAARILLSSFVLVSFLVVSQVRSFVEG